MKLSDISPYLIYQFKSESDLIKAIEEISLKFTVNRDKISDYLKDPRLVSAYAAFYLLTNIPKLDHVLKWMPEAWVEQLKGCDFVDLGSGPGTFSFAWRALGARGDFYQVELSELMKEQGKKIWDGLGFGKLHQGRNWEWTNSNEKFVLFGHSANEMGPELTLQYIKKINPDHILFIEPGTKDFFGKMLEIRAALLNDGFNVLYPCPLPTACPMEGSTDWCHQFIHVKQNDEVERISQMAKLDRKLLPLTVQAFSKTFKTVNPHERLVRVLPETKFSHEWEVCHDNKIERYQIFKRDMSKTESKDFATILSGSEVETEVVKAVGETKRVKLLRHK